jgi:large subunit ribosomal protein L17
MRHRMRKHKLGRTTAHRTATLRNMAVSLFEHGQITTTVHKAKALQPFVEKIVTLAKRGDLHSRRLVAAKLGGNRRGFEWLYIPEGAEGEERENPERRREFASQFFDLPDHDAVERNRYGEIRKRPRVVQHIFENVAPRFKDRDGGYTRIVRLGRFRIGDAAELCVIQFCGAEDGPEIGGNLSQRRRSADKRTAYFQELSKGWAQPDAPAPAEAPDDAATAVADAEPEADAPEAGEESKPES